MAQYNFKEQNGVQQGTFYLYDYYRKKARQYDIILGCVEDGYRIFSARGETTYIGKNEKVFTTPQEAEEYAAKIRAERVKEEARQAEQKQKHDAMVDAYFEKKGRLTVGDFVRMIKQTFPSQQPRSRIAKQLRPEPEPFDYYHRAFAMLRNGYVDYVIGNDTKGRCYFKDVDCAEVVQIGKDNKGNVEHRITLYKGKEAIFTTTCQDLVVPLRMIFTNYEWNNDWYSSGWKNNADRMNTVPEGNK